MKNTKGLTRNELVAKTGCPYYTITYLMMTGKLPISKNSKGRGISTIYHPDSIQIIKDYLNR
ncbi:MAG: hypothetical protein H8E85_01490 [Candidatus Marinimicrobia bacterium]|nr:hypothetical protein [Candidatus Neomarinimicrobiota bacterium]